MRYLSDRSKALDFPGGIAQGNKINPQPEYPTGFSPTPPVFRAAPITFR
jgi:hypothetical protein